MIKKILIGIFCAGLIFCMAAGFRYVKQEEASLSRELSAENAEIAPYQSEINELRDTIYRIRMGRENADTSPARIIYGYYAADIASIADEGAIILDAGADENLKNAAKATGREVIYFFAPDVPVPTDGSAVILRSRNDIRENRDKITDIISRQIDNASAGIISDELINIPYIYNKSDNDEISDILGSCQTALIVVFNPEVKNNLALLKSYFANGTLIQSTVKETKQYLVENQVSDEEQAAKNEEYIIELEERIEELQQKIDAIYSQSREARQSPKRLLDLLEQYL